MKKIGLSLALLSLLVSSAVADETPAVENTPQICDSCPECEDALTPRVVYIKAGWQMLGFPVDDIYSLNRLLPVEAVGSVLWKYSDGGWENAVVGTKNGNVDVYAVEGKPFFGSADTGDAVWIYAPVAYEIHWKVGFEGYPLATQTDVNTGNPPCADENAVECQTTCETDDDTVVEETNTTEDATEETSTTEVVEDANTTNDVTEKTNKTEVEENNTNGCDVEDALKDERQFTGNVYDITSTKKLPDFAEMTSTGEVYADEFNIAIQEWSDGFPALDSDKTEFFAIDYHGKFFVKESGKYRFALTSDDHSTLIIDGKKIIEDDNQHAVQRKEGLATLECGEHDINVQYLQGDGEAGLILESKMDKDGHDNVKQETEYEIFNIKEGL